MTSSIIVRRPVHSENGLDTLHPLLQRIYSARSITHQDQLSTELAELLPFRLLKNIDQATVRLAQAVQQNQSILIVGDFDVDGATSSAVGVAALKAMGATQVSYLVPNRFTYGYGLTPEIVDVAAQSQPQLIITVDNGISSHAGIERAMALGIDVIITDHHLPGNTLPKAFAIVNPNQPGDEFPSKNLAGVGVIFYVMLALRSYLKERGWFEEKNIPCPKMSDYLDLVALGIIADVVPLDKNNRILVHQGLRRIRAGHMCAGIAALLQISGRKHENIKAVDLGFAVGPRLNAAGRLDDMSLGIACLLSPSIPAALNLARQLDDLNKERRIIESQMKQEAFDAIEELHFSQELPMGLCVYEENWHQGVVGLVAARVKERVHRPVIAFAKVDNGTLKGSARSITGLHIRDTLEAIAVKHPDLISKFGGHAMAAGLSLPSEKYEEFVRAFAEEVALRISQNDVQGKLETDGELTPSELKLEIADLLNELGPWGQGFPEPLFDGRFNLVSQRLVGGKHLKLVLQVPETDHYVDAIAFNVDVDEWPNHNCRSILVVYRMDVNEFNNRRRLQLIVEYLQSG